MVYAHEDDASAHACAFTAGSETLSAFDEKYNNHPRRLGRTGGEKLEHP
jgi:hypothetical protein